MAKVNWRDKHIRKPLAVYITIWACITTFVAVCSGHDIGQGTASVMQAVIYICVGGYFGTSCAENYQTLKLGGQDNQQNKEGKNG